MDLVQPTLCPFCWEFNQLNPRVLQILAGRGIKSRILSTVGDCLAICGVGALTPGYILLISRSHYESVGYFPDKLMEELKQIKAEIRYFLKSVYGSASFFEHGATRSDPAGCCVGHAHMHALPTDKDFHFILAKNFRERIVYEIDELTNFSTLDKPYLFYESPDESKYLYEVPPNLSSQQLRKLWAESMNKPMKWDWAVFPEIDNMITTLKDFQDFVNAQHYYPGELYNSSEVHS